MSRVANNRLALGKFTHQIRKVYSAASTVLLQDVSARVPGFPGSRHLGRGPKIFLIATGPMFGGPGRV